MQIFFCNPLIRKFLGWK